MDGGLSSTEGVVALTACGIALIALILAIVLGFRLRSIRASQAAVLGQNGSQDLVAHAARLERGFVELRDWVEDTARGIDARMGRSEVRIDACVAYTSVVRYDAYGEMSGKQSSSVAFLDSHQTGVVLTSLLHRENERVYVKQIVEGEPEYELSPEEQQAVDEALERGART